MNPGLTERNKSFDQKKPQRLKKKKNLDLEV